MPSFCEGHDFREGAGQLPITALPSSPGVLASLHLDVQMSRLSSVGKNLNTIGKMRITRFVSFN